MFLTLHRFFELFANRDPLFLASSFPEIAPDLAHQRHSRIAFLVNTMSKSHDLLFRSELFRQPVFRAIRRPDFLEHLHRFLIRAAVQRSFECCDR